MYSKLKDVIGTIVFDKTDVLIVAPYYLDFTNIHGYTSLEELDKIKTFDECDGLDPYSFPSKYTERLETNKMLIEARKNYLSEYNRYSEYSCFGRDNAITLCKNISLNKYLDIGQMGFIVDRDAKETQTITTDSGSICIASATDVTLKKDVNSNYIKIPNFTGRASVIAIEDEVCDFDCNEDYFRYQYHILLEGINGIDYMSVWTPLKTKNREES